ncbi:hypothetical protein N7447_008646 [Penicillium robsamsonii]|uniref:uncharacterized protein n=1 Tax=Penicillium robsamsonii TaxID=1792511 RepID=UPI002548A5B8|nr:uncharacterized protein N7447_008646 [Penicillium robsamsonii]KAJ5816413.1 hypothetical protein N7447_008646 [Penicillium robsamsonii]
MTPMDLHWSNLPEEHIDVSTGDECTFSAFSAACFAGQSDVVTLLLNKGANCTYSHVHYGRALNIALPLGHPDIVPILLENGTDANTSSCNYLDVVLALLERGQVSTVGKKVVEVAIIVKVLLKNGAVDVKHEFYNLAPHKACMKFNPPNTCDDIDQSQIVLSDPNIRGEYGTAIEDASFSGYQVIVELFPENRGDVNLQGGEQSTALQMAARNGHREIVALLLDHGADATMKRELYDTALEAATEVGETEIIEMLAKKSAEV